MAADREKKRKLDMMKEENPFLSSTDLVYNIILDDIVEHRIEPGQKLNQELIADELDTSRTPVRDALGLLEKDGYLTKGAQGYTVYKVKMGDYMGLLDLRIAIEELAVRLACSRIRVSELKSIKENLSRAAKVLGEGSKTAWDDDFIISDSARADGVLRNLGLLDKEFHHIIVGASHNPYLIDTYEKLVPRIHFFRYTAMDVNCCVNMVERHKAIYDAICRRDEDLAGMRMKQHLRLTISRAMRY